MARRKGDRESRYEREYVSTNRQGMGSYGLQESGAAETEIKDWSGIKYSPIRQEGESTFGYRERKDRLMEEDARKIEGSGLPQM